MYGLSVANAWFPSIASVVILSVDFYKLYTHDRKYMLLVFATNWKFMFY